MNSFGWRVGSSMDLNSKPKVCLEEYVGSFFPQVCFVATTVESKGFPHTTSNFCKAFQSYCLRSNSGLCSLPPFPRAGVSNHGNCELFLYGQIYPTSCSHLLDDLPLPELCRWTFLQHCICLLLRIILLFLNWSELIVCNRGVPPPSDPPSYFTQEGEDFSQ